MEIRARVFSASNQSKIVRQKERYLIYVRSQPKANAANLELIKILARKFKVRENRITIKTGKKSPYKRVIIDI